MSLFGTSAPHELSIVNAILDSDMAAEDPDHTPSVQSPRDVDLGGDANLLVGPQGCQVRIRVCKALLSFASSYFNSLFSDKFKESQSVGQGNDIVLEEDEPDAVVNLCKIFHMKYTWPKPMHSNELLQLAIVADKYDCVKAIALAIESLFPQGVFTCSGSGARDLVVAAYLLDHPYNFTECSKCLLGLCSLPLSKIGDSQIGQRVPLQAWCKHYERGTNGQVADGC